jgi:hypothetical protein
MEKNALIITGQLRTFESTWENILNNIIIPNNFDVFMYIDNRFIDYEKEFQNILNNIINNIIIPSNVDVSINIEIRNKYNTWLPPKNDFIKSIKFMSQEDFIDYEKELQNILKKPNLLKCLEKIPWDFRPYLQNSGSVIEYYQYFKGVLMMEEYEKMHNIQYEYVMRGRCDVVLTEPLKIVEFFKFLPELKIIGEKQKNEIDRSINTDYNFYKYFEVSNSDKLINLGKIFSRICELGSINNTDPEKVIFTIRKNVLWCGKRRNMVLLKNIINKYGDFNKNFDYDWNSESQFHYYLLENNLYHIDYFTEFEGKYFCDMNYNKQFLQDSGDALFTILR